jgi:hypothetical protein
MIRTIEPEPHPRALLAVGYPLLGAAIVLVALALTGCGTSDSGGDAAISPKEFSAQISSTCEPHTTRLRALTKGGELRNMRRYGEVFRKQARINQKLIADLEQLQPPESVAGAWDRFLDSLEGMNTYVAELGAEIGAAFSGGKPDMEALMEVGQRDKEKEEAMNEAEMGYGEAVQDLNRAGIMSECFSEAVGEFEVRQKESSSQPPGQQPAEPNPQAPK